MELESVLLTCGFHEEDAEIILGEFLAGMVNVGEARGAPADQMMSEILTQSRWLKFSQKHLMPPRRCKGIDRDQRTIGTEARRDLFATSRPASRRPITNDVNLKRSPRHGWRVVDFFEDAGISGAKGRDKRPGLDRLLKAVARRDVDMVTAWSVDRLRLVTTGSAGNIRL